MDISAIDKNFHVESNISAEGLVWMRGDTSPFVTYGAVSTFPYSRLPEEVAKNTNEGVLGLSKNTAGIRVRFRTDSPYIAINVKWDVRSIFQHMPTTGTSGFDLYRYFEGEQNYIATFVPTPDCDSGYESIKYVEYGMCDYVINFPLYNNVTEFYIGVKEGSNFEQPADYRNSKPVVFYGSSITQGGCASRPGNCYQNFLSRKLDMDYINLGFSGSCRAEDAIVDYLSGLDMSVFVCDYDHNAPTPEHLEKTHYKLYETFRKANPDVPVIFLTMPDYDSHIKNDYLIKMKRREIVFRTYSKALTNGDHNVYYVDGVSLFAGDETDNCTVDGCHPNDLGFYRFSQALLPTLKKLLY